MDQFIKIFGNISLGSVIIFIAAMVFIFGVARKAYKTITKIHDDIQEREQNISNLNQQLQIISSAINSVSSRQEEIVKKVATIEEKQDLMENNNRKRMLAQMRERLTQSYSYYCSEKRNPLLAWTSIERDAFMDLLKEYDNNNGNSYIHTVVVPSVEKLIIIDINDSEKISELMHSRNG